MKECQSCGEYVTTDFARVFGSNDDRVYACLNCATVSELTEREASRPGRAVTH